jgi:hypothetical protein
MLRGPSEFGALHLKSLVTPTHEWGPSKPEDRVGRDTQIYGQMDEENTETSPPPVPNVLYKEDHCIIADYAAYGTDSYIWDLYYLGTSTFIVSRCMYTINNERKLKWCTSMQIPPLLLFNCERYIYLFVLMLCCILPSYKRISLLT